MALGKAISIDEYKKNNPNFDRTVQARSVSNKTSTAVKTNKVSSKNSNTKTLVQKQADSNLKSKLKTLTKAKKTLSKEKEKSAKKLGYAKDEFRVKFEKVGDKGLNKPTNQLLKTPDVKNSLKQQTEKMNKIQNTSNVKNAQKQVSAAQNEVNLAEYQKDVADVANEKTTFFDKTLGNITRATKDLFSGLGNKRTYVDEKGNVNYLPSKNELKQQKVSEDYDSGVGKFAGDFVYNTTKLLESKFMNLGVPAGTALYTTDNFIDAYKSAFNKSQDKNKSIVNASIKSGLDFITDQILGGATKAISKTTGKKIVGDLSTKVADKIFKATGKAGLSNVIGKGSAEGLQELSQEYFENMIDILTLGSNDSGDKKVSELFFKDGKFNWDMFKDAAYAGGIGFATGGAIGVLSSENKQAMNNNKALASFKLQLENSMENAKSQKTKLKYQEAINTVTEAINRPFSELAKPTIEFSDNKALINGKSFKLKDVETKLNEINTLLTTGQVTDDENVARLTNAHDVLTEARTELSKTTNVENVKQNKTNDSNITTVVTNSNDGVDFKSKYVKNDEGQVVGQLDYNVKNGKIMVDRINVYNDYKRQGYATQLLTNLQEEAGDNDINFDMLTSDGEKLLNKIATFTNITESKNGVKHYEGRINTMPEIKKSTDEVIAIKNTKDLETEARKVRSFSESVKDSPYLSNDATKTATKDIDFSYEELHNDKQWEEAKKSYSVKGYESSYKDVKDKIVNNKQFTYEDMLSAFQVMNEAKNKGDMAIYSDMLIDINVIGTELGRTIQVMSMIKKLSPEGQLVALQRSIDRLKNKNPKKYGNLSLSEEDINKISNSKTSTELDKNIDEAKVKLGKQVNASLYDKLNALRHLSMLGSPRTHIRNVANNFVFGDIVNNTSKQLSKLIQTTVSNINPNLIEDRTRTFTTATEDVRNYVDNYIKDNSKILEYNRKYSGEQSISTNEKQFNKTKIGKGVQKIVDFNSEMLGKEDFVFKSNEFKNAMKQYLTAHGIKSTTDIEANQKIVDMAANYAIEQANYATFNQLNGVAESMNRFAKNNKLFGKMLDVFVPYRNTTANIVSTSIDYSPIQLLRSITTDISNLKSGKINATEYIDRMSRGLTGTAIMALGYSLAKMGLAKVNDEDKKDEFETANGKQEYSINLFGKSFTIDWLAPSSVPFLVGAKLNDIKEFNLNNIASTFDSITQPVVETTYLENFVNMASSLFDGKGKMTVGTAIEDTIQSYLLQYIPTIGGQIANVVSNKEKTTSVSSNTKNKWLESMWRQAANKSGIFRFMLESKTDVYGNEVKRDSNLIKRALSELSPTKIQDINNDKVSKELQKIYGKTKDSSVLPNLPSSYSYSLSKNVKFKGEEYKSNAKEYTKIKKMYGQTTYKSLNELFKTKTYKNASDEEKVELINSVYTYAKDKMKQSFLKDKNITYTNATQNKQDVYKDNSIKTVIKEDVPLNDAKALNSNPSNYHKKKLIAKNIDTYKTYTDKIEELRKQYYTESTNSKDIKNMQAKRKTAIINYINSLPLSVPQKAMMIKENYSSFRQYDNQIIQYVNSQNLSIDEKTAILKSVGFKVENGKVKTN